jgi:hypothetical protein
MVPGSDARLTVDSPAQQMTSRQSSTVGVTDGDVAEPVELVVLTAGEPSRPSVS